MANTIYITGARLSFPKLKEPVAYQNSEPRFSCDFILPTNDAQLTGIMTEIGTVASEKWNEHANAVLQNCQNNRKLRCWGDGAEKVNQKTFQIYDGYGPGTFYLSAASQADRPPQMVSPETGKPISNDNTMERNAAVSKLYGGCYVNAAVRFWPQDNQFGRGIRCQVLAVQFSKPGEAFGEAEPDIGGMFGPQVMPAAASVPVPGVKMPWEQ